MKIPLLIQLKKKQVRLKDTKGKTGLMSLFHEGKLSSSKAQLKSPPTPFTSFSASKIHFQSAPSTMQRDFRLEICREYLPVSLSRTDTLLRTVPERSSLANLPTPTGLRLHSRRPFSTGAEKGNPRLRSANAGWVCVQLLPQTLHLVRAAQNAWWY